MPENIYDGADSSGINTRAEKEIENIYMNEDPTNSPQIMENNTIQDSPGGHSQGRHKLAVVLFGLLCVFLLAVIIGLGIKTEETRQLHLSFKNMTEEKDQLEIQCSKLTEQKKQFQVRNTELTAEKSQLETYFSAMTGERDELQKRLHKLESMMRVKCHAVDVTLDPDTAHANLILSADRKQVSHGDTKQKVPDSPKRFSPVVSVLGKQSFSSGRFYYEVQVKGKTEWDLGVARESITRKGNINLGAKNGYWTISLRNGNDFTPAVPSLKEKLQRVGVFVDYEAGLVSFYDADSWFHLYSYNNAAFTETLYPFFCPSLNYGGKNSSPLIITSVSVCPK